MAIVFVLSMVIPQILSLLNPPAPRDSNQASHPRNLHVPSENSALQIRQASFVEELAAASLPLRACNHCTWSGFAFDSLNHLFLRKVFLRHPDISCHRRGLKAPLGGVFCSNFGNCNELLFLQ